MLTKLSYTCFVIVLAVVFVAASQLQATPILISNWGLDETTGTTVYDSVGGYNGTAYGGPTMGQSGVIGKAFRFDGSNDYIDYGDLAAFEFAVGQDFTLMGWVKSTSCSMTGGLLAKGYAYGSTRDLPDYQLFIKGTYSGNTDDGRFHLRYWTGATYVTYEPRWCLPTSPDGIGGDPNHRLLDNNWHHLAGVYDYDSTSGTATAYVYLDGQLYIARQTVAVDSPQAWGTNNSPLQTGRVRESTVQWLSGTVDDLGIWKDALSQPQILAIYNTPLVAELNAPTTGRYGLKDMRDLFALYEARTGSVTIGDQTWYYFASLPNQQGPGKAWHAGGEFFIQLGADGSGVSTIPEPSAMLLLSCGLVGLLCYAWRKRK